MFTMGSLQIYMEPSKRKYTVILAINEVPLIEKCSRNLIQTDNIGTHVRTVCSQTCLLDEVIGSLWGE